MEEARDLGSRQCGFESLRWYILHLFLIKKILILNKQTTYIILMKTIQKKKEIKRVSDDMAYKLVKNEGWKYIPKSVWKEKVRDK